MRDYIFINQDLDVLKKELDTSKKAFKTRLLEQCERYFGEDVPDEHPKASTTYMGIGSANLALAYIVTDDERYLIEAKRWIFACVKYPHWGNAHLVDVDLSAAWILFGLGLCYDWLKDVLTPEEKLLMKDKLILQGTRMYDFKIKTEGSGWSTNYWQNHNWINLTGLAAAGYGLGDEYEMSKVWTEMSKENFDYVYKVMAEDGSDYEGVVYWRYGAMWLFVYAHLVKERENIDYFKTSGFLKNTFSYRLYQAAPNLEEQINFGDAHDRRSGHSTAIYYKTAAEYGNGHAQKLGNLVREEFLHREQSLSGVKPGIYPEAFFEVLFYDDSVEEEEFSTLDTVKYFDDLGLMVIRSSWEEDAIHFSFKCSYPGGKTQWQYLWELKEEKNYNCFGLSHQHPDNNSFILNAFGHFMAIDDGYNRTVKASDHNVMVVDGKGYFEENQNNIWKNYSKDMVAEVETVKMEDDFVYIVGESSKNYDPDLKLSRCARHIINTKKEYFVVIDEMDSTQAHEYSWTFHGDVFPEVKQAENLEFTYQYGDAQLKLVNIAPTGATYKTYENRVRAVMTTQEPDKFRETVMKTLQISNENKAQKVQFLNVLLPSKHAEDYTITKIQGDDHVGVTISAETEETFLYSDSGSITYDGKEYITKVLYIKQTSSGEKEVVIL